MIDMLIEFIKSLPTVFAACLAGIASGTALYVLVILCYSFAGDNNND